MKRCGNRWCLNIRIRNINGFQLYKQKTLAFDSTVGRTGCVFLQVWHSSVLPLVWSVAPASSSGSSAMLSVSVKTSHRRPLGGSLSSTDNDPDIQYSIFCLTDNNFTDSNQTITHISVVNRMRSLKGRDQLKQAAKKTINYLLGILRN